MKFQLTLKQALKKTLVALKFSASYASKLIRRLLMIKQRRKTKLTDSDKRIIEAHSKGKWTDQGGSIRKIENILKQTGTTVCKETIRKYIIAQPWGKLKRQPRTFMLTKKNKQDRLLFASRLQTEGLLNEDIAEKFAKSILFTDEKYFYLNHKPNSQNHRFRGDISELQVQNVPKFDVKVLVCGGFSYRGVTPIKFIEGTIDKDLYTDDILPFYQEHFFRQHTGQNILKTSLFEEQGKYFMQDGAKPHTAKISIAFIREKFPDCFFDWPGNSPDLNPIENLWAIVQAKVDQYPFATTKAELIKRIKQAWGEIKHRELQNLALAFPKRVKSLLNNQ